MDKMNFVRNGVMRLPPGFRFHPTDEELVDQYLKRKVYSFPLPASIIPEIDVCKFDPWDLPGNSKLERYFFSTRQVKYLNGNRPNRATSSGYWKTSGRDKQIVASKSNQVVGMKKVLVFYRGKPSRGIRTDWIMHEYRLSDAGSRGCISPQRKNSTQNSTVQMEDWVLCRIFLKNQSPKNDVEIAQPSSMTRVRNLGVARNGFIDFMGRSTVHSNSPPPSSSSSSNSSSITELSSAESHREENSSCDSFSSSSCGREP
ncbi:NAC domain-containing protein 83-like isoform X2 [Magnolia sinica]|uniref:NAC domain-containing protein 83-like isoform X2 n=1 Tax=Magnolia sinica TaxID=86752 RepID=UPI0026589912|nr:NAC domain-containing protein 83-like isoform X2 [Magnolia sinica]